MSAAHPNSLVFGRRSRAVPVCPPPLPSFWSVVGIWEFDAVVVRLISSRVAPFFSASGSASPRPSLRLRLRVLARGPLATKDHQSRRPREELTFPSPSPRLLCRLVRTWPRRHRRHQRPRSTPTALRVAARLELSRPLSLLWRRHRSERPTPSAPTTTTALPPGSPVHDPP